MSYNTYFGWGTGTVGQYLTNQNVTIGGGNVTSSGTTSVRKNIYCVRFYNRTLTAEEAQHNHNIDKERYNLTSLVS